MYDAPEPAALQPAPPCVLCRQSSETALLEQPLCRACWDQWCDEAPLGFELELAHADKHPEDVDASGQHQWVNQDRWVVLKPGVSERLWMENAQGWLTRQKARAA